jgi:hypothetical protein
MPICFRAFWLPRRGHDPAEYEDAFAAGEAAGRFAVADGATEGCFTGLWARLLVEDFVNGNGDGPGTWPALLPALQEHWDAEVHARDLPWYAEEGVRHGASATFLGLVLQDSPLPSGEGQGVRASYQWQAVGIGDTCLLHTRGDTLLRAFPIGRAEQFDNFPKLVGSRMSVEDVLARQSLWTDGRGQSADRLWMMTDALAQWCLTEHEAGGNPWTSLEPLLSQSVPESEERFVSLIESLRDGGGLRNDDVTLLAIEP